MKTELETALDNLIPNSLHSMQVSFIKQASLAALDHSKAVIQAKDDKIRSLELHIEMLELQLESIKKERGF